MRNQLVIYRANNKNTGHALNASIYGNQDSKYNNGVPTFHLSIAKQTGKDDNDNGIFDWKGACNVKLGIFEMGEFLAVIRGLKKAAGSGKGLYHDTDKATTSIVFEKMAENAFGGEFSLRINRTDKANAENKSGGLISFNWGEAMVFEEFLVYAMKLVGDWGVPIAFKAKGDYKKKDETVVEEFTPAGNKETASNPF
jgi:hypothetical protein